MSFLRKTQYEINRKNIIQRGNCAFLNNSQFKCINFAYLVDIYFNFGKL